MADKYEGNDPTLKELQEQADKVEEVGYAAVNDQHSPPASEEASDSGSDDGMPAKSASRGEWDEYARSQGVDPDEFATKEDLIEALS